MEYSALSELKHPYSRFGGGIRDGSARVNMGRRHTRKITVNDSVTNYLRYIYRGYLQIAAINAVSGVLQWFIRRESARRPPKGHLRQQVVRAIGQTHSVCPAGARSREAAPSQVFSSGGTILTAYTYTPYGSVTANGNVTQPIQWSSEYNDTELGLVYYNYRHYNPTDGRWTKMDIIIQKNPYLFIHNNSITRFDILGLIAPGFEGATAVMRINKIQDESRVNNQTAHKYCDSYLRNAGAKCCCDGRMVVDDYVKEAANMCHNFVDKYSHNGQVILSVECVAKCLSEAEDEHMEIKDCSERNSARLLKHFSCYASCSFFLFDSHSLGTPEGGWEMGFNELLPDLMKSIQRKITEIFN